MRICLELDDQDIEHFLAALRRARHASACADDVDIIDAAKYALDHLPIAQAPAYMRRQLAEVQQLIIMLEDEAFALPQPERGEVLEALRYVGDPDDLIPDEVAVIGLLDDAIVLELLLGRLRHVRRAYADFCTQRALCLQQTPSRMEQASRIAALRGRVQARLRRAQRRAKMPDPC